MTNGRGESNSAIVTVKPTNKAGQPAAAPAEPRVEAKGNAGQQSTCRAQNRVSVSQALERIRQAARQRKKEKFTALFHHVSIDYLEQAFLELRENAAPGLVATNFIVGRCTASAIASASLKSFFCPLL
jgi:RNA-directed DNA polymerase